jgi:hypothetical protein
VLDDLEAARLQQDRTLRQPMAVGGMRAGGVSGTLALMSDRPVVVPDAVRQKAAARGAEGTRWLRGLGDVIEQALSLAEVRRSVFDPETAVLVHGDAHSGNTLRDLQHRSTAGARFKFIDPDGLFAERAYDLAIPMPAAMPLFTGQPVSTVW